MYNKSDGMTTMRSLTLFLLVVCPTIFSRMPSVLGSSVQCLHGPDPLRTFKYYNGGYDLRSKHYWASAAFTGIRGYAMAGAWLLLGMGFGILLLVIRTKIGHGRSQVVEHPNSSYYVVFSAVILFTLLAIIATGFVLAASQQVMQRTERLKATLLGAGSDAQVSIHKVNKALSDMQVYLCPYDQDTCTLLNKTSHGLGSELLNIQQFVKKNGHLIDQVVWTWYIVNLVVVSINLTCLIAAFVFLLFHWQTGFITIIFFCWILTTICWILSGVDFFLDTFAEDTCTALQEFKENPDNSSLSSLIPCANSQKAENFTIEIGGTIHNFITELNSMITEFPKQLELYEKDADLQGGWKICNPFSSAPKYIYAPGNCPNDSIPIGRVPEILARFNCYNDNESVLCRGNGRLFAYDMAYAYAHSLLDLISVYPDLENLIHCSFVKDKISEAGLHQCGSLMDSTRWLWTCVLSLSILMVGLVLIWVIKAYLDNGRCFSRCSVVPCSMQP